MPPRWMATALHGPSQQGPEFHSKQTSEKRLDGDVILKSESRMKKRGYICLVFNMIDYAHKIETPSAGPRDISHQPVADKHSPGLVNAPQSFSLLRASLLSAMSVPVLGDCPALTGYLVPGHQGPACGSRCSLTPVHHFHEIPHLSQDVQFYFSVDFQRWWYLNTLTMK